MIDLYGGDGLGIDELKAPEARESTAATLMSNIVVV